MIKFIIIFEEKKNSTNILANRENLKFTVHIYYSNRI